MWGESANMAVKHANLAHRGGFASSMDRSAKDTRHGDRMNGVDALYANRERSPAPWLRAKPRSQHPRSSCAPGVLGRGGSVALPLMAG